MTESDDLRIDIDRVLARLDRLVARHREFDGLF